MTCKKGTIVYQGTWLSPNSISPLKDLDCFIMFPKSFHISTVDYRGIPL